MLWINKKDPAFDMFNPWNSGNECSDQLQPAGGKTRYFRKVSVGRYMRSAANAHMVHQLVITPGNTVSLHNF
jgi:hypothetical protein